MRLVQLAAAQGDVPSTAEGGAGKGGEGKQGVNGTIDHEVAVLMEEDLKIGHAEQVGRFVTRLRTRCMRHNGNSSCCHCADGRGAWRPGVQSTRVDLQQMKGRGVRPDYA